MQIQTSEIEKEFHCLKNDNSPGNYNYKVNLSKKVDLQ